MNELAVECVRLAVVEPSPRRLALTCDESAVALGMSRDLFDDEVRPSLRVVQVGRRILVPIAELEKWLERTAARPLGGAR